MIALLLPGARVIVCTRDLRDVAVSCRLTSFETNPWTHQWEHIAQHSLTTSGSWITGERFAQSNGWR